MTSSVLQQLQHQQQESHQLACIEPSAAASRSVVDAWLRKLRLHSRDQRSSMSTSSPTQCASQSDQYPKRKQPSFIKALFKPHELKAIKNSSPVAASANSSSKKKSRSRTPESNQSLDQQHQASSQLNQSQYVVPPVEIPSSYMGRSVTHHSITVGGRRVPFTRDAHRRMKKMSVKALASVAETHPVSSLGSMSMAAYRSRAYYPAAASSSKQQQRKEKR